MKRKLYQVTIIIVSLFVIQGMSRNLLELWQQRQRLARAKRELLELEQKELDLRRQLADYQSDEYVEKIARDKLLWGKEGETIVLLPAAEAVDSGEDPLFSAHQTDSNPPLPNWKKWARLFGL